MADKADTLDYYRMALVVDGLANTLSTLATE